jgi:NAD(P)-dependent dehydrogenase (short-subunit alcohol dehydrogenase family)
VVTGAASGIGRALAQRFARHGCPVAIADQDEAGLADTAATIDGPVFTQRLDVRDRQGFLAFAAQVAEWAPAPLGVVVNNAGVTVAQSVAGAAVEDDEWVLDINLGGVITGTRAFLPLLLEQDAGVLVNVSSVFGLLGFPHQSAYCASKFAVRGFTESLRHELRGSGVRAVTVHPGGVKTNIVRNARYHMDATGTLDQEQAVRDFNSIARTTPERAAKIIHTGIEQGRSRIRVGPDAVALDLLVRIAPTRYFDVLARIDGLRPGDGPSLTDPAPVSSPAAR